MQFFFTNRLITKIFQQAFPGDGISDMWLISTGKRQVFLHCYNMGKQAEKVQSPNSAERLSRSQQGLSMQLSYLQISPSDICFKAQRDQAKFLPQLGALEAGFSETPLWVTHNAHTLFPCHVFGTPPSLLDTGSETRKNNPLNPVLVVAGSH